MQLSVLETTADSVKAGYECPCGCRPRVTYERLGSAVHDGCCCGNEFVVGPESEARLTPRAGFRAETQPIAAPWGVPLQAAWLIGPSVHGDDDSEDDESHHADDSHHAVDSQHGHAAESDHADESHHHAHESGPTHGADLALKAAPGRALDPVCGMTVDPESARAKGLHAEYKGVDYYFCGRGCKLDFEEDPERYLNPSYQPSM